MRYETLQRFIDPPLALTLLLVGLPLWLIATLAAALDQGVPFFSQTRIGQHNKPFRLLKLRTMRMPQPSDRSEADRITLTGHLLRRSGLDEWPQLINILRGEMTWIGPRPLLPHYLPWYTAEERYRHAVKPGITGLAQVRGGNALRWPERLALDVEYVRRKSFAFDLLIIFYTVFFVIRRLLLNGDPTQDVIPFNEWAKQHRND
jgi:lipopolysaccharide/colanic/teichoic acid biosynthesis glycosyltransferase